MLYRVLRTLSTGHTFGDVVKGDRFKPDALEALLKVNALCLISGPPLRVLAGWARRAELLEPFGITTAIEFLDADPDVVRDAWGHSTHRAVNKARAEIEQMLDARIVKKYDGRG